MRRPPHYLVIVRAGETAIFEALKEQLAHEPHPTILIWDRRCAGGTPERRPDERRTPPDSSWQMHRFLVVEADGSLLEIADAYRNAAAEAQRQIDFYRAPPDLSRNDPPFPDRFERPFGLEMFKARLHATVDERRARAAHDSPAR